MESGPIEIRLLGPPEAIVAGAAVEIGSAKQRAVLAALALDVGTEISAERLIDTLWGEEPPGSALSTLRSLVYRLRRALTGDDDGDGPLLSKGSAYLLDVAADAVDAGRFERLVDSGREALRGGQAAAAAGTLREALGLWRGPALGELAASPAFCARARHLDGARLAATEHLAEAELALDRPDQALERLEAHVAAHPLRERAWGQLMLALYRAGRQADALRAYQQVRAVLAEELGIEPGPALRDLETAILRQRPELSHSAAALRPWDLGDTLRLPPHRYRRQQARLEGKGEVMDAARDISGPAAPGLAAPGRTEPTPFVGRAAERAELRRRLDAASVGEGALVMLGGEPGVGKTRLTTELMAEARQRDLTVFAGHSYEMEGAAPYIAFVEIFEAALAQAPSAQAFRQALGEEAAEVARLVPSLRRLCPDIPRPLELPPEQERRLLFNSVREVVTRSARWRPVLLVLDDLHWSDGPTLLLVEHLAEVLGDVPVLIVATYRDTDVDVGRPLAKTFEDLRRRRLAQWLAVDRLPEPDVAQMLRAMSGQEPPPALVDALYSQTDGNPFFLEEVYRYLAEGGRLLDAEGRFRADLVLGELDVPFGVRLVVQRRLARLAAGTPRVLATAAVVGRAFSVELLEVIEDAEPDAVVDAIEDAERARLIVPAPDPSGEDRFIFGHELIRQTLLADLSLTRRRRLHGRVADALERHYAGSLDQQSAAIAYHLREGGAPTERTYAYLVRAGRWAMAGSAFEEALRHYEAAHQLGGTAAPAERAAGLFDLGTARRSAGQPEGAMEAWRQSVEISETIGDVEAIGRVCEAGCYNLAWLGRFADAIETGERGLAALGDRVSAERGRLLGYVGWVSAGAGRYQVAMDTIDKELALADELGDDALRGHALAAKAVAHWVFTEHRESAEAGRRAVELLRDAGEEWRLAAASGFLVLSLVYLGRFEEALRVGGEFGPLAERLGNVASMMQHRRSPALVDLFTTGDIDRFEAFAAGDREFCQRAGLPWVSTDLSWLGWCRFLKGDWDAAVPLLEEAVRGDPPGTALTGWSAGMLFECLAYRGDKQRALAVLEGRPLPALGEPKTFTEVVVALAGAEGLTVLGERERAAALYPAIVDIWERAGVPCPSYEGGRLVQRAAGIAAFAGRDYDAAEAHFRVALEQAAAIPHRIEEAHTRRWYGQMLLERDGPGDRDSASGVLRASVADYQRMGIPIHREMSERLLAEAVRDFRWPSRAETR